MDDKHLLVDRSWCKFPVGTKAFSISGGYWIKTEAGWKWHTGDTFPTPGWDAYMVELPAHPQEG